MASIRQKRTTDGIVFHVRIRKKGFPTTCATFARKTDARAWTHQVEQSMRLGRYLERVEGKKHTLGEAIARYLQENTTYEMKIAHLKRWNAALGHMLLADITSPVIAEVINRWKDNPNDRGECRQGSTLNRHLTSLSTLLTSAVKDWGWIPRNPALDVRRQKEPKGRTRFLSEDERTLLLEACKNSYCPHLLLVVVLALSTGMRKSEIMTLKWSAIDLNQGIIILTKTKNKELRRVPVRRLALELLRAHNKVRRIDSDYIFPGIDSDQKTETFDIRKAWQDARRRAGIENFVFHDLRHSCASYLAMGGATLLEIAEVLGHKTLDMVKRYAHLADSHTAGVVERMNQRIFG